MGYVLSHRSFLNDDQPPERRADTALDALRAYVAYLREDHVAPIQDSVGEPISPAELLHIARAKADDPASRQELTAVLADYADTAGLREMRWAQERYQVLNSRQYQADRLASESPRQPNTWRREADAEEAHRLGEILDNCSTWHLAGTAWFRDFHVLPPEEVLTELRGRDPHAPVHELRVGAEAEQRLHNGGPPRYQVVPSPDGPSSSVRDSHTGRLVRRWAMHPIARAHAETLNAGRPWSDRNYGRELDLWSYERVQRRVDHERSTRGSGPATPPLQVPPQRTPGRRP